MTSVMVAVALTGNSEPLAGVPLAVAVLTSLPAATSAPVVV